MTTPMFRVPEAEADRNFGIYRAKALTQPVALTSDGEPRLVLISIEEYERLKRRDRQALAMEELTEEEIAAIAAAEPPAEAAAYDPEGR